MIFVTYQRMRVKGPCWAGTSIRPWLPLGLVHFFVFGGVSGSGGIWEEVGDWLIRIGGEEWVFWYFCQGSPCFGPCMVFLPGIPLFGAVYTVSSF